MAVRDVVLYPDDPLTRKAKPYKSIGPEVAALAEDMCDTMFAYDGVGLAGPQVGVSRRILVWCEPEGEPQCLVNPEIYEMDGSQDGEEGCLSLPQIYAQVTRASRVRVRGFDQFGNPLDFEGRDFLARVIQHECDHLDGIVFPDRLDILTREAVLQDWKERREQMRAAAQRR